MSGSPVRCAAPSARPTSSSTSLPTPTGGWNHPFEYHALVLVDEGVIEFDAIRAFDMEEAYDVAEGIGDGGYTHVVDVLEWDADPLSYAVELLEDERGYIYLKHAPPKYTLDPDTANAHVPK